MLKRVFLVAALLLLWALILTVWWKKPAPQHPAITAPATAPATQEAASTQPPTPTLPQVASSPTAGANAQTSAQQSSAAAGKNPPPPLPGAQKPADIAIELDAVQLALRDFRTAMGANPIGTNAEITQSMLGDNLKQVKIPVPQGSQLNGKGELCDRWGTPYFFHQISHDVMEVRSAGADRVMWTDDDVEVK